MRRRAKVSYVTIKITDVEGRCRWCRCTDMEACPGGCSWVNAKRTVCSECKPLDDAMRSIDGRRQVALSLQEHPEDLRPSPAAGAPARKKAARARRRR